MKRRQRTRRPANQSGFRAPFVGLMTCAVCGMQQQASPGTDLGWRGIEINDVLYRVCPQHFPPAGAGPAALEAAYKAVISKLVIDQKPPVNVPGGQIVDPAFDQEAIRELAALADAKPLEIKLNRLHVYFMLTALQLALRHPGYTGPAAQQVRRCAEVLQQQIAGDNEILMKAMQLGWNPAYDQPLQEPPTLDASRAILLAPGMVVMGYSDVGTHTVQAEQMRLVRRLSYEEGPTIERERYANWEVERLDSEDIPLGPQGWMIDEWAPPEVMFAAPENYEPTEWGVDG